MGGLLTGNVTDGTMLDLLPPFPMRKELDATPSKGEVEEVRDKTKKGKALEKHVFPAEFYTYEAEKLTTHLYRLIRFC